MTDLISIKAEVLLHAKETYPNECCGLAVVVKGKLQYKHCRNINPGKQFAIHPDDYAACADLGEIVGVCHSHVNESVNPSESDLVGIESSKVPWLIVNPDTNQHSITFPTNYKLPLLGRQFKHGTVDCLSLIRDYCSEIGIQIPDYYREDDWWLKGGDLYREKFAECGFVKVGGSEYTAFKKHDLIIMQVCSPVPNHGAIYIGDNLILQHCHGRLSSRDVYGGYWRKVTNMVLRHKDFL